ncbi:MAG: phosphate ABC transporter permease PstA, partial [Nitrospirae bacterium]
WGNFYGYLKKLNNMGNITSGDRVGEVFLSLLPKEIELCRKINKIKKRDIEFKIKKIKLSKKSEIEKRREIEKLLTKKEALEEKYRELTSRLLDLRKRAESVTVTVSTVDGREKTFPLYLIVRAYFPNKLSTLEKMGVYLSMLKEFLTEEPREANTEGGIFPAIFGTVMMIFIMSIAVTPFGVLSAIYLNEYAKPGRLVQLIRISINNLAGVPSIVFGVFGLGFFIYTIGGTIDSIFFKERLPTPTFGTGGILWASLTLALMTVPVVIVATEEGLRAIPKEIREASLALGATKFETLYKIVLPGASPGILTGVILAMAKAAGEVAPLMLTGVVKLAPSLPFDRHFPYFHLERKFMHLGFHIYDVGFQSPNVEAALPVVYNTTLVLLLIIIVSNLTSIALRNRLRKRYSYKTGIL